MNFHQKPQVVILFFPKDSIRVLVRFKPVLLQEEYILLESSVDILSYDSIFLETDLGQGMIFKQKQSGIIHNFTLDVYPVYK